MKHSRTRTSIENATRLDGLALNRCRQEDQRRVLIKQQTELTKSTEIIRVRHAEYRLRDTEFDRRSEWYLNISLYMQAK